MRSYFGATVLSITIFFTACQPTKSTEKISTEKVENVKQVENVDKNDTNTTTLLPKPCDINKTSNDPLFLKQWYLHNRFTLHEDSNLLPLLCKKELYKKVFVSVVDTGIDANHSDLKNVLDLNASFRYSDRSHNPSPTQEQLTKNSDIAAHGTACAGIIAAEANSEGIMGIAQNVSLVGFNVFSDASDASFASALNHQNIDISSNSWGSAGAHFLYDDVVARESIEQGIIEGRGGKGVCYIFAAGNDVANANFQSVLTTGFVVAVSAVTREGILASYSDFGSSILVAAPGGGRNLENALGIITSDISGLEYGMDTNNKHYDVIGNENGDYTNQMNGTSAAAPVVSGVVALMLGVNHNLTYRDVQYILAKTARHNDINSSYWRKNGAGYWIHDSYGFGVVDAFKAVEMAKSFPLLPSMKEITKKLELNQTIYSNEAYIFEFKVDDAFHVEYAQITINTSHNNSGKLKIVLTSPSDTNSTLTYGDTLLFDKMEPWTLSSVHFLDEKSEGIWKLYLQDMGEGNSGVLKSVALKLKAY